MDICPHCQQLQQDVRRHVRFCLDKRQKDTIRIKEELELEDLEAMMNTVTVDTQHS